MHVAGCVPGSKLAIIGCGANPTFLSDRQIFSQYSNLWITDLPTRLPGSGHPSRCCAESFIITTTLLLFLGVMVTALCSAVLWLPMSVTVFLS